MRIGLTFYGTLSQLRIVVINKPVNNKLKYIPNFLLFFQFRFDLLGDLIFRSASKFFERRIWSTICDSYGFESVGTLRSETRRLLERGG